MIERQLVFRNEYRLDLRKVNSVLIPYLFDNDASLIISLEAQPLKKYKSSGRVDQILIDYPNKLVASSQILRFGNQELDFPQRGRFQLSFFPNAYLGLTKITIHKMFLSSTAKPTIQTLSANIPIALVDANNNRKGLAIYNLLPGDLTISTELTSGSLTKILCVIPSKGYYELPGAGDGGIYCGAIYGKSSVAGDASITEFVIS